MIRRHSKSVARLDRAQLRYHECSQPRQAATASSSRAVPLSRSPSVSRATPVVLGHGPVERHALAGSFPRGRSRSANSARRSPNVDPAKITLPWAKQTSSRPPTAPRGQGSRKADCDGHPQFALRVRRARWKKARPLRTKQQPAWLCEMPPTGGYPHP